MMKKILWVTCAIVAILMNHATFADPSGLFFNVASSGSALSINTTIPHHTYPFAGIRINTKGYSLTGIGTQCSNAGNGFCLFSVSDTQPVMISFAGGAGQLSVTLCLNGKGPLSCQNYTLTVVTNDCGRFKTGFTGSWSTVANNPLSSGMGFSGYLPQGLAATFYLGRGASFDSFTTNGSGGTYTPLASPPTSFESYGSMAYFGGSIWTITSGHVIKYDITTNTWTTPATGLVSADSAQTTIDDMGNLWSWQDESHLLKYNIASGTTAIHDVHAPIGSDEPRIVYDSCSGLLFLASYDTLGFYSYDPVTGTVTTLPSLPGSVLFQDGFCSDRSGHIFAVNNDTNMFQYTISTGVWTELPAGGLIGASNSSCGIGSDGYLYASDPDRTATVFRIKLE